MWNEVISSLRIVTSLGVGYYGITKGEIWIVLFGLFFAIICTIGLVKDLQKPQVR